MREARMPPDSKTGGCLGKGADELVQEADGVGLALHAPHVQAVQNLHRADAVSADSCLTVLQP